MRRTRDNNWQFFLFLLPAIAAGFGVNYMMKKNKTTTVATNTPTSEMRDRVDADEKTPNKFSRKLGDKVAQMTEDMTSEATEDRDTPDEDLAVEKHTRAPASVKADAGSKKTAPLPSAGTTAAATLVVPATEDKTCTSFELRGDGMSETHVSNEEWTQVMGLFHQSKANLQTWLVSHNTELPGGLVKWMSEQVENAKLQRPPLTDEPDLNWRGIGVIGRYGQAEASAPLLRVGGGFVKMSVTEPQRAHFELTRLLAQSFSPCDMPTGARMAWQPLLKCMGLKEQDWDSKKSCAPGSQSEAGWAVASAIAVKASPPGCTLPAFQNASIFQCVTKTAWFEFPKEDVAPAAHAAVVPVKAEPAQAETSEQAIEVKSVARFTGKPEVPEAKEPTETVQAQVDSKAAVRSPAASLPPNAAAPAAATSVGGKN